MTPHDAPPRSMLLPLFDHLAWADARALAVVRSMPADAPERPRAVALYAHLAGAAEVWLARLEGRPSAYPVWPELDLDAATAVLAETIGALRALAAGTPDELAREVDYRNTKGEPFRNTVADILLHVAVHGSYHRGQLALLARQGGVVPALTDYIAWVREVDAPR